MFINTHYSQHCDGAAFGSALTGPENLAIGAGGRIYVIEDQPTEVSDIAEYLDLWLSNVGFFFRPNTLTKALVVDQHPNQLRRTSHSTSCSTGCWIVPPVTQPITSSRSTCEGAGTSRCAREGSSTRL